MQQQQLNDTLHALCNLAAEQTLQYFRAPMDVANKLESGFDPVTIADQAAERAIRTYITSHFPDHGILGEEEEAINPDAEYCWIIDPIDGTRAFISGLPSWGTLIGLNHNGVPMAGVMHQPFTGEKFFTSGRHAFFEHKGKTSRLKSSAITSLGDATLMSTAPELLIGTDGKAFQALSQSCRLTRFGFDCYAYAMVAAGHIELVLENNLKAYDIAPLIPVIEQAGGIVKTWEGKSAANGGRILAAANETLLDAALQKIRPFL